MKSIHQPLRRVRLAVVALGLIGVSPAVFAAGTDTNHGIDITNTASVNYSVNGVAQGTINSSPTGNSAPGAGTATSFRVDKKIMFVAEETNGAATATAPNVTQVVTTFRVSNTTNGAQEFSLIADNVQPTAGGNIFGRADSFDMSGFTIHVSAAACVPATMTTPAFNNEPATTFLPALGEDSCAYVFVRANTPAASATVANGLASTIRLRVRPSNTSGTVIETPSGAADNAAATDIVWAESGILNGNAINNGESLAFDQYVVGTLTVTKVANVISDGFSAAGQAKAIPGAVVEYLITVRNNGLATTAAAMTEAIPTNTTYVAGSTTLNGTAVADVAGAMPFVGGRAINSPAAASGVLNTWTSDAADNAVVRFRVTIQ
jgi:uncharacterized repeat protein (TIGR01451 family)